MSTEVNNVVDKNAAFLVAFNRASHARSNLNVWLVSPSRINKFKEELTKARLAFNRLRTAASEANKVVQGNEIYVESDVTHASDLAGHAEDMQRKAADSNRDAWKKATMQLNDLAFSYSSLVQNVFNDKYFDVVTDERSAEELQPEIFIVAKSFTISGNKYEKGDRVMGVVNTDFSALETDAGEEIPLSNLTTPDAYEASTSLGRTVLVGGLLIVFVVLLFIVIKKLRK